MDFTDSQERAIRSVDDHLQIIACAGSGKTRVLVERICYILQNRPDIKPENIIAFTFTEKAAAELKNRIDQAVKQKGISSLGMADMYVGTIHGYCLDFLQQHCMKYQKYSILNEIQVKLFVQKNIKTLRVHILPIVGNTTLTLPKYTSNYLSAIGIIREESLTKHPKLQKEWKEAFKRYDELFHQNSYFDFSMIIDEAIKELSSKVSQEYLKNNIRYLIVDEYQDLNPLQEKLLSIFYQCGVNICVVGDDDQTIYQWRGSNTDSFLTFKDRYTLKNEGMVYLDTNFRSTSKIVEVGEGIIKHNQSRFAKDFKSGNKVLSYRPKHDLFFKEFESYTDEAEYIAGEIEKLIAGGMPLSEIAVLTRKKILNKPILEALSKRKISVIVEGVAELFDQPITEAAQGIFYYISDMRDESQLLDAWLGAAPQLAKADIQKAINGLGKHKQALASEKWDINFQQIFRNFLQTAGFHKLADKPEHETLAYNLGQFSVLLGDFERIHFKSKADYKLKAFESFITYLADGSYPEGELLNMYIKPEAVQIMTIHKSKGLEFGAVFVPGLSKNSFPLKGVGGLSIKHHLDIEHLIEGGKRYLSSTEEDERRLFYVAITRSKKFLYLTRAKTYLKNDGTVNTSWYKNRSPFLQEALNLMDSPFIQQTPASYEVPEALKKDRGEANTAVNFSLLSGYFKCPFLFKLDNFYSFQEPLSEFMGFGKSMHDMVKEIHLTYMEGGTVQPADLPAIVDRHFHMPYASGKLLEARKQEITKSLEKYYDINKVIFPDIQFVEQKIEIPLSDTLLVSGRIDLIKSKDGNVEIIDFKTSSDIPNTKEQALIYALGYKQLTGKLPDTYCIYNVEKSNVVTRDAFAETDTSAMAKRIQDAVDNIKTNRLPKCGDAKTCKTCHKRQFCHAEDK